MSSAATMPMPVSATANVSRSRSRAAGAAVTVRATPPRSVNFTALSIRFSSALRSRTASPIDARRQIVRRWKSRRRATCPRRARSATAPPHRPDRAARTAPGCSTSPPPPALAASTTSVVSRARCSAASLIAAAQPPLALRQIGRQQQFGQRQNAGQRRADVVGETGERDLGRRATTARRVARDALFRARRLGLLLSLAFGTRPPPCARAEHGTAQTARATRQAQPACGYPPASCPARAVRAGPSRWVDLDSLRPSSSRISR